DQALACVQQASANARDLAHAFPLGFALTIGELHVHQLRREPDAMRATLRQLETLSPNVDQGILHLWMTIIRGWLTTVEDHDPAGLPPMQQIFDRGEITDTQGGSAYIYLLLAEAYLALGQVETAHTTLEHNLAHINETGLRFFEAETLRRQGEVLRKLNRPGDAETYFQRAIAVAQEQAARSWELRAMMSLYKLRQAEGPQTELTTARQQLAEIYDWFTEGFDTPDLQEAAALLRQV
ncbi:MAG: tetratricopeptide repeat protein, partial [Anaerolineae bacterium]